MSPIGNVFHISLFVNLILFYTNKQNPMLINKYKIY